MYSFRLQYHKEKVTDMIHTSEDINKKMSQLTKKTNKLSNVLLTLIKPSVSVYSKKVYKNELQRGIRTFY